MNPKIPSGCFQIPDIRSGWPTLLNVQIRVRLAWLVTLATLFCACGLRAGEPKFADVSALLAPETNTTAADPRNGASPTNAGPSSASVRGTNTAGMHTPNSMDALDDKYRLAIGDRLSFRIVEDEDDPKALDVTDSGDLELPYIGRYPAVGKTCKQLAHELEAELEKDYYYQATVIIAVDLMTKSRGKVYLVGPIREPGPQDIPSDEVLTLSKAILRGGGFTDYADKRNVKVTRKAAGPGGEDQTFTVDVGEILEKGKVDADLPLQAGDLIYVPERLVHF